MGHDHFALITAPTSEERSAKEISSLVEAVKKTKKLTYDKHFGNLFGKIQPKRMAFGHPLMGRIFSENSLFTK